MSECFVCGRKLRNPCTASRGCGPVCCGPCGAKPARNGKTRSFRSFYQRIVMRWGRPWGLPWERWLELEQPCAACKNVVLLKLETRDGGVTASGRKPTALERTFSESFGDSLALPGYWDDEAIPAWCRRWEVFIDANRSSKAAVYWSPRTPELPGPCPCFGRRSGARPTQMTLAEVAHG